MAAETATLIDFTLPSLGSDMEAGTVIEWLVAEGDTVRKGDVLVRVDTEKADIDVETWQDGAIVEIVAEPGETLAVGETLARLATASPATASSPTSSPASTSPTSTSPRSTDVEAKEPEVRDQERPEDSGAADSPFDALILDEEPTHRATPAPPSTPPLQTSPPQMTTRPSAPQHTTTARGTAVSPRLVYWPTPVGLGPTTPAAGDVNRQGSVTEQEASSLGASDRTMSRAERRQRKLAEVMTRSNRDIPHFYLSRQIDVTEALTRLAEHNANVDPAERVLPAAMLLHAVAMAAKASVVNGHYEQGPVDCDHVHLGVAVNLRGGGLVTPVIPDAETLQLPDLMAALKDMVARAKSGRMTSRDMTAATLTVTNLGDTGVDRVFGVIRPPERTLVGFGALTERPTMIDGTWVSRSIIDATIAADHRVVNGHAAARFLAAIAATLEDGAQLSPAEATETPEGDA